MVDQFSKAEIKVLQILGDKKMTISEITNKFYGEAPFDANNIIAGVVRRIVGKCDYYDLDFTLKGEGSGRHGKTVWREQRKKKVLNTEESDMWKHKKFTGKWKGSYRFLKGRRELRLKGPNGKVREYPSWQSAIESGWRKI